MVPHTIQLISEKKYLSNDIAKCNMNLIMEELSSAPQPSWCDTLKSFMKEDDNKYLEFFECAGRGHAQGWQQSSIEELD